MSANKNVENNKLLVRRLYEECINPGKLELLPQLISPNFVDGYGKGGFAEFANGIQAVRTGFPDVKFTVEDLIGEGERIAVRWTFQGTHTAMFAGTAASHKEVRQTGNVIFEILNQKIVRAWVQVDRLGLLQQINAA